MFHIVSGTQRVVLCEVTHADLWQGRFQQIASKVPVEQRDFARAVAAPDRGEALYLTESGEVRAALLAAGVEAGRILLVADLALMLRVRK